MTQFSVTTDRGTRTGTLHLPHGDVPTPAFMPIATRGAVRVAPFSSVRDLGASIILANTFHLLLRPGVERLASLGGLHAFLGWSRPMLTDSGGFQVFSLAQHRSVTDDGVRFRSPVDGTEVTLTPESAMAAQRAFGSDVAMVLDEVCALPSPPRVLERAVARTTAWARRSKEAFFARAESNGDRRPLLFGIVQGGTDGGLRRTSAADLLSIGFDGYAIGGLSVGESREDMLRTLDASVPLLPANAPRYLMGVGEPEDIVEAVRRGIDMFDCVLPTRNARHALLYANLDEAYLRTILSAPLSEVVDRNRLSTRLHIMNEQFAGDPALVNPACPLLEGVSRAYLRHLFMVDPPVAQVLATTHNLWFYLRLMASIREIILP